MQIHKRKGDLKLPCSLSRQGKNCECYPAYSFQFINIERLYASAFISQPCALCITFDKYIYTRDV